MNCEYSFIDSRLDGVDNFLACVGHYAKNTQCSLAQAFRELSLYAYKWVLGHFDRRKAHRIHRNVLSYSFFWLAFMKAYADRSKPGRNKYDPERMSRNLAQGQTAMLQLGDPLDYEGMLFVMLGQLFDDVRHQKLAVCEPCCPDYSKQEDEIVQHLQKLARDKRNDSVRLPASVPDAKQVLDPRHPWYSYDDTARYGRRRDRSKSRDRSRSRDRWMPRSEEADPNTTRMEAPKSTDTEMYQALESELLICSDYQAGLVRNAAQAMEEVTGGDACCVQFREPTEEEEEEAPHFLGTRDRTRGRSILKKITANTAGAATSTTPRQPHKIGDIPRGIGSPLDRFDIYAKDRLQKTYNWYSQLKKSQLRSQTPSSRKRERQVAPKPPGRTPTQSPLQKSGRLQSVVTIVKKQPQDQGAS